MSIMEQVNFDEAKQSQLPAVEMLVKMGYKYISRKQSLELRNGRENHYILSQILRRSLMRINSYDYEGQNYDFSETDIDMVADELENIELDGVINTAQQVSAKIMPKLGGAARDVMVGGRKESRSLRFFDFDHIANNEFHVTVEYKIAANDNIRCDIVCFVNGIPLVVIENKKSSVGYQEAIKQLHRYQSYDYAPKLFVYAQLLLAMDSQNAVYGTAGTPAKFYTAWREKGLDDQELNQKIKKIIAKPIEDQVFEQILTDLNGYTAPIDQKLDRSVKNQDIAIYGMLRPERLMDIVKNFVFYDGIHKKVARYQQYFAIKKINDTIKTYEKGCRKGGVVWHTQGSGKSLTMVMLARHLIEDEEIKNPRILIVTDRIDLDKQIKSTFVNAGLKKDIVRIKTSQHLINEIKAKNPAVLTTLVQKFEAASKKNTDFVDEDQNIFILIDEVHRTQSGEANFQMLKCLPNACVIGFTGTPLLRKDKTRKQFGDFIDKYTIDDALDDGIILPLIYEGRYSDLYQDDYQLDHNFEQVRDSASPKAINKAKEKINKDVLASNSSMIKMIGEDIEKDFVKSFKGKGLKGQIVAPRRSAALQMQKLFEHNGKIKTALVISDQSGEISDEDIKEKEIADYLKKVKNNYSSLRRYEEIIIDDFINNPDGVELLIVVDKLLTGFDAPCNTVLYLAKEIKDHNLLQAVARVNRLYENSSYPKTAGYIIDYSKNAENIDRAMELFGNFDPNDIKRALIDVDDKIQELGQSFSEVEDIFKGLKDDNQMIEHLRDEAERKKFVSKYNKFLSIYNESVILRELKEKISADKLKLYKNSAKKFAEIKKTAALQYDGYIDLKQYQRDLENIVDKYVNAKEVEVLTDRFEITNSQLLKQAIEDIDSDKTKAEAIAAQTKRVISEYKHDDEVLYKKFSDQIAAIIESMHEEKMADAEALAKLRQVAKEAEERKDSDLPDEISKVNGADVIYRNLRQSLPITPEELYQKVVLEIVEIINQSVAVDWWSNYELRRQIQSNIDDYLYDVVKIEYQKDLDNDQIASLAQEIVDLAKNNHNFYG